MPRRLRKRTFDPGTIHHVFTRGFNQNQVFGDEADYMAFLRLLGYRLEKNPVARRVAEGVECIAYALLPNHLHLVLANNKSADAIPKLMTGLLSVYARDFNRKWNQRGKVWDSFSYGSRQVESPADLLGLVAYVNRNPMVAGVASPSTHDVYLGKRDPEVWLSHERVLAAYGGADDYAKFIDRRTEIQIAKARADAFIQDL